MPIIDEEKLAAWKIAKGPVWTFDDDDVYETVLLLWRVARMARRWVKAAPGTESVEAEAELVNALRNLNGHD